jgi:hypothetical protein
MSSTVLLLILLPAGYAIMEDLGITEISEEEIELNHLSEKP